MIRRSLIPALATGHLLAAPFAAAQPPADRAPPAAAPPWQVDWGRYYCSLIRLPAANRPFAAAFLTIPGDDRTELLLIQMAAERLPGDVTSLLLEPTGRSFDVRTVEQLRGTRHVLAVYGLPYEFRADLSAATELQLRAGSEPRLRIPLDQAPAAVAAHRRCTAGVARQWQLDEAALAALRQRPASTNFLGYRPEDYPSAALRTRTQGRVVLRITVTAEGRAGDCRVVASSGEPSIDARSCQVAMQRARFTPGLDAAGQPVTIPAVFTVTWRLPGMR
jgi:TonB family protein